jgi:sortase A
MTTLTRRLFMLGAAVLLFVGVYQVAQAAYIHVKAQFAQFLLRKSWERTMAGAKAVKPWPWADTWPVARLEVPRLGVDQLVLADASGEAMAFGPGHLSNTAAPGAPGNTMPTGHRGYALSLPSASALGR